jgi:hypothetical protein
MPRPKGLPKTGGRKKGENKALRVRERILGVEFDIRDFSRKFPETYFRSMVTLLPKINDPDNPDHGTVVVRIQTNVNSSED